MFEESKRRCAIGIARDKRARNKRLVAAAPELLAALESAFIALGKVGGNTINSLWRKEWEQARAAIAKAKRQD